MRNSGTVLFPEFHMNKDSVIGLVCLVTLLGAGAAKFGFDRHRSVQERAQLEAGKPAMFAARDRALAEIKKIGEARATDNRAVEGSFATNAGSQPAETVKTPVVAKPLASVVPPPASDDPEIQEYAAHAKISSLLLGDPRLVVIDKREYEVGSEIVLPRGRRGRIAEIAEDGVRVSYDGRSYRIVRR
jgi:hypothetical protein